MTFPPTSLTKVELAILTNEEDAFVRRDALGYVAFSVLLEVIGPGRQRYIGAVRFLIDHDAREHNGPVIVCMRVSRALVSGRHSDECAVWALAKIAVGWRGIQFTVRPIR